MARSNTDFATGTRPGWATQVPSWPSPASRSLSAVTLSIARRLASASSLIGICADIAPVARADGELAVRPQEVGRHRHFGTIGKHICGIAAQLLDEAEDVVPAA